jgi:hypothetical protein
MSCVLFGPTLVVLGLRKQTRMLGSSRSPDGPILLMELGWHLLFSRRNPTVK